MFMLTMGAGMNFGFPDTCNTPTPVGPIPIPYPNIAMSATSDPVAPNLFIDAMPVINQISMGQVSVGDEAGLMGGLVDADISGGNFYILGCFTIFMACAPAQRLTSMTGQNALGLLANAPGCCLAPSQVTLLALG